ncbi:hypothetical protein GPUN_2095 [Glaciecola punicea ACAM 611]|mgnify:CR=1 FL=1|uniref:Uncharacterized protein n=1 Tax=Glaciecola punicea ACAM 611 TaxID=1121923 RepID=H5TD33_9ALTE|nr:hypothetical protein GPUN_2095 [Glaciecola punicea ACAM 611]
MFLIVGGILAVVIDNADTAKFVIILISIAWAFVFGPWAIVTFLELILGFTLVNKLKKEN